VSWIDENPGIGLITGVVDTGEYLIAGVNDARDKHKVVNISVSFRRKFEMEPTGYSGDRGKLIFLKKLESKSRVRHPFNKYLDYFQILF
jgi:hypothetical protein